jgi:ABC-type branched-subunit amino acid transport system ATPase component
MRALMARPRLLILDEPLAGVYPALADRIIEHIRTLRDDGLSVLLIEHDLGAVERLCDNVFVMAQGRLLAHGPLGELRQQREVQDAYLLG